MKSWKVVVKITKVKDFVAHKVLFVPLSSDSYTLIQSCVQLRSQVRADLGGGRVEDSGQAGQTIDHVAGRQGESPALDVSAPLAGSEAMPVGDSVIRTLCRLVRLMVHAGRRSHICEFFTGKWLTWPKSVAASQSSAL